MMDHGFSDDQLSAYLDGETDPELSARIDAACAQGGEVVDRLAALGAASDMIRGGFEAMLETAPAMVQPAPRPRMVLPFGAGLAAGLAGAALIWGGWAMSQPPKWEQYVAAYQALYTPETVAGYGLSDASARRQLARHEQKLRLDFSDLPNLPGLSLRRAQVLGFGDKPLLQIAYADADGRPVALCIIERTKGAQPLRNRTLEGLPAVAWASDTHGFLLIGGRADTLQTAAELVQAAL